jgi:hypothetical protein
LAEGVIRPQTVNPSPGEHGFTEIIINKISKLVRIYGCQSRVTNSMKRRLSALVDECLDSLGVERETLLAKPFRYVGK